MNDTTSEVLNLLLNLKENDKRVFVFDIDSTLYDVTPRNQAIVRHFAQTKDLQPDLKLSLESFILNSTDWGIKSGLMRLKIESLDEHLIKSIKEHWNLHFFSSKFLYLDKEYPGVVSFLNSLDKISPVYYLTGRDIKRMGKGTDDQLKKSNFPLKPDRNKLILKPDQKLLDHQYKLNELIKLKNNFDEIHFFENEPLILNTIYDHPIDVKLYHINSVNSGRALLNTNIQTINPYYIQI